MKACKTYVLDYSQHGEDCEQELWIYALYVSREKYNPDHPSKAKFTTYVRPWLNERANRYARTVKDGTVNRSAELHDIHTSPDDVDELLDLMNKIRELDPLVLGHELDQTDAQLAEQFGMSESQVMLKRREAARRLREDDHAPA